MNKRELRNHLLLIFLIVLTGWGLGARRDLPTWHQAAGLLLIVLIGRMMDYYTRYFRTRRIWLYCLDFGIAHSFAWLTDFLPGQPKLRTLTLGIFGPFDFLDISIGVGIVLMFAWFFSIQRKYDLYKKVKTEGMTFREKLGWEWRLAIRMWKGPFLPASRREYDDSMEEITGKVMPKSLFTLCLVICLCLYLYFPHISPYIRTQETEEEKYLSKDDGQDEEPRETQGETQNETQNETWSDTQREVKEEYSWLSVLENETQQYPLLSELPADEDAGDYIRLLSADTVSYAVESGDTLWGIARRFYGKGALWNIIHKENPVLPGDGALLFPGMELHIPASSCYIKKQEDSLGGLSCPSYSNDAPYSWIFTYPRWEPCLDCWASEVQDSVEVYQHVTKNRLFPDGVSEEEWKDIRKQITASMEKTPDLLFSDLEFSKYYLEDGRDLLFYTFICDNGTEKFRYAAAYVPGKIWLAEFIGRSPLPDAPEVSHAAIGDITRYMAATFIEKSEEISRRSLKTRPYTGYETWPFEDLHNPFAMAAHLQAAEKEEPFVGEDTEISFSSEEWGSLLYSIVRSYRHLTDEEWEELKKRPLRRSDLSFVTEVELTESPIPGRDSVKIKTGYRTFSPDMETTSLADYKLTTCRDLTVFPNLKKLTLEAGGLSDFEVLEECARLTELSVRAEEFPSDAGFLAELPNLRSLTLGSSVMTHLNAMGFRKEASTFDGSAGQTFMEKGKLEDALAACTSLTYLQLEYSGELDMGFLTKLPNLYTFWLEPDSSVGDRAEKRDASGIDCPQIKCLVIDGQWIRNPE